MTRNILLLSLIRFTYFHWIGPLQCLSVCVCVPLFTLKNLISPIHKCGKSNWSLAIFSKKWLKLPHCKSLFVGLCHSLLMDLGKDQQHYPTVHSGGVSRVHLHSPSAQLPRTFRSPCAPLPLRNLETWNFGNSVVFNRFQLFTTIFIFFQQFSAVFNYFQPFSAVSNCFQPFPTVFNHFHPFWSFQPF